MCGLCGSFTQDKYKDLSQRHRLMRARVLEGLLVANAARGTDATGIATIQGDERSIYKRAVPSMRFVDDPLARKAMRDSAQLSIGHTRYGTMGGNVDKNAHPFLEGNVIGTHNGVISNHGGIEADIRKAQDIEYKDWTSARVDSQAAFRLFDHAGPENYIDAISKISGSAALVWHDTRHAKGLWMVSHSNPLNAAWVPTLGTMFWSSQYDHLSSVLWSVFGDNWLTINLKEDTLYLFKSKDILEWDSWPVKFKQYTTQVYGGYSHGGGNWRGSTSIYADGYYDDNYDVNVKHPYQVASVSREGGGTTTKGKAPATSPSSPSEDSTTNILRRMGIPADAATASTSPVTTSKAVSSREDEDEESAVRLDQSICEICNEPANEDAQYNSGADAWVCRPCVEFWEEEGMGALLEGNRAGMH